MKFDSVIFDLDGTLTDSAPGIIHSIEYALDKTGYTLTDAQKRSCVGPPLAEQFELLLGVSPQEGRRLLELYREYFKPYGIFENSVYDGIYKLLEWLKSGGYKIMLCTGKPEVFARKVLDHFDLTRYFDYIIGPTLDGKFNDKADGLAELLRLSGSPAPVFVGDRLYDIHAAKANGIPCIGVLWGYGSRAELEENGADFIAADIPSLKKLIN